MQWENELDDLEIRSSILLVMFFLENDILTAICKNYRKRISQFVCYINTYENFALNQINVSFL